MKTTNFALVRYDADEGKVFDWAVPRYIEVPDNPDQPELGTHQEQEHLYVKTLFIGGNDNIENYVEVDAVTEAEAN